MERLAPKIAIELCSSVLRVAGTNKSKWKPCHMLISANPHEAKHKSGKNKNRNNNNLNGMQLHTHTNATYESLWAAFTQINCILHLLILHIAHTRCCKPWGVHWYVCAGSNSWLANPLPLTNACSTPPLFYHHSAPASQSQDCAFRATCEVCYLHSITYANCPTFFSNCDSLFVSKNRWKLATAATTTPPSPEATTTYWLHHWPKLDPRLFPLPLPPRTLWPSGRTESSSMWMIQTFVISPPTSWTS